MKTNYLIRAFCVLLASFVLLPSCLDEDGDDGGEGNPSTNECEDGPCCLNGRFADAGASCDDGDLCTYDDICNGTGSCGGTPVLCEDENEEICGLNRSCNGTDTCTESYPGEETVCDDGFACTSPDTCDGAGGCYGDAVVCTENAVCMEADGACVCKVGFEMEGETCEQLDAIADFDDLTLESESYWNGADEAGYFASGGMLFNNNYDSEYLSWDGFAYSNITDTDTHGYDNQYGAMTGGEINGSANYAVGYHSSWAADPPTAAFPLPTREGVVELVEISGLYVTNDVYTYYSMLEGDDYAKKFGGETGDDPDWYLLTITGIDENGDAVEGGVVEFYLADFRFEDNSRDYIIDDWTWVDLSGLGEIWGMQFSVSSSDVGEWGMNTPAYFAIDSIIR